MTTPDRDRLDAAIDQVAARMVAVPDERELTLRIVTALPERTSRLRWLMPQLAAIGAIVIAAIVWTTRNDRSSEISMLRSSAGRPMIGLASPVTANEPGTALRTMPLESAYARDHARELRRDRAVAASGREGGRLEPLEPLEPLEGDHERALPAIEAVSALVVSDLTPRALPATPALELAPIAISDLPLTAESFPPR
jgi:hypothetical protein